jgi:hypothetical protein
MWNSSIDMAGKPGVRFPAFGIADDVQQWHAAGSGEAQSGLWVYQARPRASCQARFVGLFPAIAGTAMGYVTGLSRGSSS